MIAEIPTVSLCQRKIYDQNVLTCRLLHVPSQVLYCTRLLPSLATKQTPARYFRYFGAFLLVPICILRSPTLLDGP
jgi:hypothetical protein